MELHLTDIEVFFEAIELKQVGEFQGADISALSPDLALQINNDAADLLRPVVEPEQLEPHAFPSGLVMLVLAQEQEVLADLVFSERGRVTLEMLGQLADVANLFFFGRWPIIFELDQLFELRDRRLGSFHRPGRMPSSEDNFPAKLTSDGLGPSATNDDQSALPRSGSVQPGCWSERAGCALVPIRAVLAARH